MNLRLFCFQRHFQQKETKKTKSGRKPLKKADHGAKFLHFSSLRSFPSVHDPAAARRAELVSLGASPRRCARRWAVGRLLRPGKNIGRLSLHQEQDANSDREGRQEIAAMSEAESEERRGQHAEQNEPDGK
jgi:hypothetical protein